MKKFHLFVRMLACLLALVLAASVFVSCGVSEDKKPDTPQSEPQIEPTQEEPTPDESPEPLTLNIGSYNIANGSKISHQMKLLAQDILSQDLDIVGLQEVDINANRSHNLDTMKVLSELTGYKYYAFFKSIPLGSGEYGVAVLSKYPILDTERIELDSQGKEQRVLGRTRIDVNGTKINFFVTHVSYEDDAIRARQLLMINAVLRGYDNFILTGDFNTSNFEEYTVFENAGSVNTAEHHLPTYEKKSSIDNIVFSLNNWTFGAPAVLANDHSDHSMLYATGTYLPK